MAEKVGRDLSKGQRYDVSGRTLAKLAFGLVVSVGGIALLLVYMP